MGLATTTADDDEEPAVATDAPSPTRPCGGSVAPRGPSRTAFGGPSHPSFLVDGVAGDGIIAHAGCIREYKVSTPMICVF